MTVQLTSCNWLTCPQPKPKAQLRLFCFPCAGATAPAYRIWANKLPPEVEIYLVQLPGRGSRLNEQPFTKLSDLVQTLVPILQPHLNIPFAFFGHSLGALLSFEIARQLRRQNFSIPVHLFVCCSPAPQKPNLDSPIHALPTTAFLTQLRDRYNGIPLSISRDRELMQLFLPSLRADLEMLETYFYTPEKPLDCSISAFGGWQDLAIGSCDLAEWRDQTCNSFSLQMFPGDHFFLHNNTSLFLQVLSQQLSQAIGNW